MFDESTEELTVDSCFLEAALTLPLPLSQRNVKSVALQGSECPSALYSSKVKLDIALKMVRRSMAPCVPISILTSGCLLSQTVRVVILAKATDALSTLRILGVYSKLTCDLQPALGMQA